MGNRSHLITRDPLAVIIHAHSPSTRILELLTSDRSRAVDFVDSWFDVPVDIPQELAKRVAELATLNHRSA